MYKEDVIKGKLPHSMTWASKEDCDNYWAEVTLHGTATCANGPDGLTRHTQHWSSDKTTTNGEMK